MQLKHSKTLITPQQTEARIQCIAWSPTNKCLAVCNQENTITLFDENGEKRDRFSAKPVDPKYKKQFVVKSMIFSQDGVKLAVGQSDNIVYVYRLGENWDEKKVICNKFPQKAAVTCLLWPPGQPIICGLADGKVRAANVKTNKSSTIYNADSYVISMTLNNTGKGFLSGHADGKIVRYFFDDEGSGDLQGKLVTNPTAPYALAWTGSTIWAGGCDRRIYVYNREGKVMQQFDYSKDDTEKEFMQAVCSPSGQCVAFGSFDRIRLFCWSPRKSTWDESRPKEIKNLYTITAMAWEKEGTKLTVGTICGGVEEFTCCSRKRLHKDMFELNFLGPGQVMVKNMKTLDIFSLKSKYGYELDDVRVMGNDQYVVAHTTETILLGDLKNHRSSEVRWQFKNQKKKFYFGYPNLCLIFGLCEVFIIEYGVDELIGSVRTEFINPYLISVRLGEIVRGGEASAKRVAYMMDVKTIAIMNLSTGENVRQIQHDCKLDWIELNEAGDKLLYRDKRLQLLIYNVETNMKTTLLNLCSYVQWVPGSDVVVAQSRDNLCIWYNVEAPDRFTSIPLKGGDILDIVKRGGRTEVLVSEGMTSVAYGLDDGLIEFATAMEDGNFPRAVTFLESLDLTPETKSMWSKLAQAAIRAGDLLIAERCYAASNALSKVRYLRSTRESKSDQRMKDYHSAARLAILEKDFKAAEQLYLAQNATDEVTLMYKNLNKWENAIEIAEAKGWAGLDKLRKDHLAWLAETGQDDKAAELRQKDGDLIAAVKLYLRAGVPGKAACLVMNEPQLNLDQNLMERVIKALVQSELFEKAGELYQHMNQLDSAMRCYRQGHAYQHAVELARNSFPSEVVRLEEAWGDHLVDQKQHVDSAIHHFIEAGAYLKAVDAAISSRQWAKAAHILSSIEDSKPGEVLAPRLLKLAQHYADSQDYEEAEKCFVKANHVSGAIEMFNAAGMWEDAHRLASEAMEQSELTDMYLTQAEELENIGRLKEAERLYLTVKESDRAITMYKRNHQYRDMLRLVRAHNPDLLDQTLLHLANELEGEGNLRQAEQYYMEANDWKSAVNMYRTRDQWEEAYRVATDCKNQPEIRKQVAYLWAKSLGGEPAVRLLSRLGLLEVAIDYATEHCAFEFAFDVARIACPERMKEVHNKHAMYLEDEGKFSEAEVEFIKADKPREAVLMYVHNQDWDSAARVAADHDSESVNDVLLGQARLAFANKQFARAEALLLRAQRPDMAVRAYREAGMWEEALRVAEAYLPNRVQELQEEFEDERMRSTNTTDGDRHFTSRLFGTSNLGSSANTSETNSYFLQARDHEAQGEYLRAVECYLKLQPNMDESETDSMEHIPPDVCQHAWLHAAKLAVKFLPPDSATKVTELVASRLSTIKSYALAGELLLSVDKVQNAIDAFIAGEDWTKARRVARELEPRLESYVERKYKEALKSTGQAETLASIDIISALDMYAEQGRWEKCLAAAEQQLTGGSGRSNLQPADLNAKQGSKEHKLLHKYVAAYAASLIKESRVQDAMMLYKKYGAPAYAQNFNIYKRIFQEITSLRITQGSATYPIWSALRDMLYDLNQNAKQMGEIQPAILAIFERMLLIAHYYAAQAALSTVKSADTDEIIAKLSISLLRHSDMLPADRVFYEAGSKCRQMGWDNMAFVFLNRYLDLVEAIEDPEGSADALDSTDFQGTDIPMEVPLPEETFTTHEEHEAVREWILMISMDQKLEQSLPTDERGVYVASLESAPGAGLSALPCIISGYPVLRNGLTFEMTDRVALRECWNQLQHCVKLSRSIECTDVKDFILRWCGKPKG